MHDRPATVRESMRHSAKLAQKSTIKDSGPAAREVRHRNPLPRPVRGFHFDLVKPGRTSAALKSLCASAPPPSPDGLAIREPKTGFAGKEEEGHSRDSSEPPSACAALGGSVSRV